MLTGVGRVEGGGEGRGEKQDKDTGVRTWTWWDNLKNAPGLASRLAVCIIAVCAHWRTSLSVVGEMLSV